MSQSHNVTVTVTLSREDYGTLVGVLDQDSNGGVISRLLDLYEVASVESLVEAQSHDSTVAEAIGADAQEILGLEQTEEGFHTAWGFKSRAGLGRTVIAMVSRHTP